MNTKFTSTVILLSVVTIITFGLALFYPFIQFDDQWLIYENYHLANISYDSLKVIFNPFINRSDLGNEYLPIRDLSYVFDIFFWGFNPIGFHLTSLLIHIVNCIGVYLLLLKLTEDRTSSCFAALIFAIHPLQVESVIWASSRKEVLYLLFLLLAFLCYLKRGTRYYFVSLLFFILSFLSKASAVIGPVLLGCLFIISPIKVKHRSWQGYSVFFVLAILATLGHMQIYAHAPNQESLSKTSILFSVNFSLLYYVKLFIFPINLAIQYPKPTNFLHSWQGFNIVLAWGTLTAVITLFILMLRHIRTIKESYTTNMFQANIPIVKCIPGILWFVVALFPTLYIVTFRSISPIADRYFYLASIGLSISFVTLLMMIPIKNRNTYLVTSVIVMFSILSIVRVEKWSSHKKLFEDSVLRFPNTRTGIMYRSLALVEKKKYYEARKLFDKIEKLDWLKKATFYKKIKEYSQALDILDLEINHTKYQWKRITAILIKAEIRIEQRQQEAKPLAEWVLKNAISPDYRARAFCVLGDLATLQKNWDQALKEYKLAQQEKPKAEYILTKRGDVHVYTAISAKSKQVQQKHYLLAKQLYKKALLFTPDFVAARINLGWVYYYQKDYQKALKIAQEVLTTNKDNQYAKLLLKKAKAR